METRLEPSRPDARAPRAEGRTGRVRSRARARTLDGTPAPDRAVGAGRPRGDAVAKAPGAARAKTARAADGTGGGGAEGGPMWRTVFTAMNTRIELHLAGGDGGSAGRQAAEHASLAARAVFAVHERTLSRFLPDSALSRANAGAGAWQPAPPLLAAAVQAALAWAARFPRLFDPTVLPALHAAGYDRSFEQVPRERTAACPPAPREPAPAVPGPGGIAVDRARGRIFVPAGTALDLGGIGKGLTVDAAVAAAGAGWAGILCNAGGDVLARGRAGDGPWRVGIDDPLHPGRDLAVVALRDAALCTSSTRRRSWRVGGEVRHHLIDPVSGGPSRSGVAQATAVAATAVAADVLAKVLVLGGSERAAQLMAQVPGAAALLVLDSGETLTLGPWKDVELDALH